MQDQSKIQKALEHARTKLQSDEHIVTVGLELRKGEALLTQRIWTISGVFLFMLLALSHLNLLPHSGYIFGAIVVLLCMLCALAPFLDLIRNSFRSKRICILTDQRVLSVELESTSVTELGKREEVFKIETKSKRVTLELRNGTLRLKAIEGLQLPEISTSSED